MVSTNLTSGLLIGTVLGLFCVHGGSARTLLTSSPTNVTNATTTGASSATYKTLYDMMVSTPELMAALRLFEIIRLVPLLKDPKTMITCFLPSGYDAIPILSEDQDQWMWGVLLALCLRGQTDLLVSQLPDGSYQTALLEPWSPNIYISRNEDGEVFFETERMDKGKIIQPDLRAGRSIIHLIEPGIYWPSIPPTDSFFTPLDYTEVFSKLSFAVFSGSYLRRVLSDTNRTSPLTILVPTDDAWNELFRQVNITMAELLANKAAVNLLTAAHVINGSTLYTGAFVSYGTPVQLQTLAGPLNATANFDIFPRRPRSQKFIFLSNEYVSDVGLLDYDLGGNDQAYEYPVFVGHMVDKVLLPISVKQLSRRFNKV